MIRTENVAARADGDPVWQPGSPRIVRTGPLTWAQLAEFQPMFWRRHGERRFVTPRTWRIGGDVPVAAVRAAWVAMTRRHEVLRSMFALDAAGRPVQRVIHPDDVVVPVEFRPAADYPALTAGEHLLEPGGLPWSVIVLHEDGIARGSYLIAEHVLYDAISLRNWRTQIDDLIADPHRRVDVVHPIDLANAEPLAGHPRVRRAVDRYAAGLSRSAQVLAPATRPVGQRRFLRSTATYPGLAATVEDVARRCAVSPSVVLVYAVGWLIARFTRQRSLPLDLLYANRPVQDDLIGCQVQHVFFAVDFAREPAAAGIQEVARATLGAIVHGRLPMSVADEVRSAVAAERGAGVQEPLVINVLSGGDVRFALDRGTEPGEVVDEWFGNGDRFRNKVGIVVDDADVDLSLAVDTAMFPRADLLAILADLPTALGHLRDTPDRPLTDHDDWSTTPFPLDDGLVRVGPDWVRPHRVAALIEDLPGVRSAAVTVEDGELVATVTGAAGLSFFDVHEHVLAAVWSHTDVVAPARYRSSPGGDSWHVRDRPPLPPATDAEFALRDAIRRTHGFTVDDLGRTYVTAGGEIDLAPAVTEALAARGYTGLRSAVFTAPLTLRAIARTLTRDPVGPPRGDRR